MIRAVATAAVSAAVGASGATAAVHYLPTDQPFDYFVACDLGDAWSPEGARSPIFGGRVIVTFDERIVELVGPVAASDAGAEAAAVDYGAVYNGRCQPVPAWDVWKLSTQLIGEIGVYSPR